MNKKQLYEAPDAELLEVCYEENFCQSGGAGGDDDIVDDEDDY